MIDWSLHPVGGENYLLVIAAALVLVALLALGPARRRPAGAAAGLSDCGRR